MLSVSWKGEVNILTSTVRSDILSIGSDYSGFFDVIE